MFLSFDLYTGDFVLCNAAAGCEVSYSDGVYGWLLQYPKHTAAISRENIPD
uniref:Uncharacterized protein n=1 Tax=Arion vulgaris TaxID=1028688 RepID=A0A0B7B2W0_9EUPU